MNAMNPDELDDLLDDELLPSENEAEHLAEHLAVNVEADWANQRLDKALTTALSASHGERFSRQYLQGLIAQGCLRINGKVVTKESTKTVEGTLLELTVPAPQAMDLEAENLPLAIVYEDEHLLIVNKPVGMLTHPAGSRRTGTLVNALLYHAQQQTGGGLSSLNGKLRPGIVHRLDKDTQGLLAVAKTNEAHRHLSQQLKAKTMRRHYRAIVQGMPTAPEGTVEAGIGRNPKVRHTMQINLLHGRSATTHWQVLHALAGRFSYLLCRLETGRTHQIRVHMAHIGLPLLADPVYGSGLEVQWRKQGLVLPLQGQALQACHLELVHPATGQPMVFELPEAPELAATWALLHKHYGG
jgi:23S rRNA pseudouridine1911/1915/1917 synthase